MKVRLYVEGGPKGVDADGLRSLRQGFKRHFERIDERLKSLDVILSGSTNQTIKSFVEGVRQFADNFSVALLVDADTSVAAPSPALHLEAKLNSAGVPHPARTNIFLMVQCMESWLVTDVAALEICFGNNLRAKVLPQNPDIEAVQKRDVLAALGDAIRETPKKKYHKVQHAAEILAILDPNRVGSRSLHARQLHAFLRDSVQA